jgi:hypothetical protein
MARSHHDVPQTALHGRMAIVRSHQELLRGFVIGNRPCHAAAATMLSLVNREATTPQLK